VSLKVAPNSCSPKSPRLAELKDLGFDRPTAEISFQRDSILTLAPVLSGLLPEQRLTADS
jgi:hypothetical protein